MRLDCRQHGFESPVGDGDMKANPVGRHSIFAIVFMLALSGCAGVGYLATSDPNTKLAQADQMTSQGRCGLAELTIGDAMKIFREEKNQKGIADAHLMYGLLYKSDDCVYGPPISDKDKFQKSIDNFEQSRSIYNSIGDQLGVVNSLSSMAEAQYLAGKRDKACENWAVALDEYRKGKASGQISGDRVSTPGFNNMGEIIQAYLRRDCPH